MTYGRGSRRNARAELSPRELAAQSKQSLDFMSALYGAPGSRPSVEITVPPEPKRRARAVPGSYDRELEGAVKSAIIKYLLLHPAVGLVERVNNGMAVEYGADGKKRYIKYNSVYRKGLRKVDIDVTLKAGARRMVIEVKRPGWKRPTDAREEAQAAYIAHIVALGGIGFFATSVDEVAARMALL